MKTQLKYQWFILYKLIQLILGSLFVVSGFVKGVDPVGVSYKVKEYLELFGFGFFDEFSLWLSMALCAVEIFIGLMLLVGIYRKIIALAALIFMLGFTAVTFYLVVDSSATIQECGCFGEAFKLSNTETFIKNIFFVTLTIIYTWRQFRTYRVPSSSNEKRVISLRLTTFGCAVLLSLFVPLYSFIYLPPFDFLPFNRGVNILDNIRNYTAPINEVKLLYKNKQNGEITKFELTDTAWQDTSTWEYIDTETTEDMGDNALSRFAVYDKNSEDVTSEVLADRIYTFIIIAQQVESLTNIDFERLNKLYELSRDSTVNLYLFTSSDLADTEDILKSRDLNIKAYNVDQITLKSMIRNPKGVMMLNNGVIGGKWNLKHDSFENLSKDKLPRLIRSEKYTLLRFYFILISGVLLLSILVFFSYKFALNQKESEVTSTE